LRFGVCIFLRVLTRLTVPPVFRDMDGGSRGFTVFNAADNTVAYDSGNEMEFWTARIGHYPEECSEKKG
jgi:hypothetical protein